jgi:hypothetical protein
MTPTIQLNQRDKLNFTEKMALLAMPKKKRTWILKTLGRWERKNTRKRISQQKDIHGRPLEKKQSKQTGKMLKRMGKGLEPYVRNANRLELTWKNRLTGRIAARHHLGQKQRITAAQMKKRWGSPDYKAPCTKGQARRLRELGFVIKRKKGKGTKKPSIRWIMENLNNGKAGLMIRTIKKQPSKTAWDIPLAERKILGSKQQDVNRQLIQIIEQARRRK